jgi:hypothetical protein
VKNKKKVVYSIGHFCLLVALAIALTGCAGPKVATDLLSNARTAPQPLVQSACTIDVGINPSINNYEKLDKTVASSLEIALAKANLFGQNSTRPYRIDASILVASQSPMSFGSFEGTLEIHYVVHDDTGKTIVDEKIHTVAGSDKFYFAGAKRHRRARAVNISKNVLQFVEVLRSALER